MIFQGEKWACEACVRGHRVSNCNHSDRPLQHINKKGRPVTQCAHCRAQRKSRSSHVKCDCGEKTSKCSHLQQTVDGHSDTCCCNHGGKCSCCGKMEPSLDTVPEAECDDDNPNKALPSRPKLANRRRRANTIHSDNMLSFDASGNRKPVKHNRTSHQVGPYQLNRVNSAGAGMDSVSDGLKGIDAQRRVKSEATSPLIPTAGFQMSGTIPPLDLSNIEYSYTNSGPSSAFDLFGAGFSPDNEAPLYSAGLNQQSVDWSGYDFQNQNDAFGPSSYSAAGTHGYNGWPDYASNSEYLPNLVNTTSNSGDVSEAGDWNPNVYSNGLDITGLDQESFYKDADQGPNSMAQTSFFEHDPAFAYPDGQDALPEDNVNQMHDPFSGWANSNMPQ